MSNEIKGALFWPHSETDDEWETLPRTLVGYPLGEGSKRRFVLQLDYFGTIELDKEAINEIFLKFTQTPGV